MLFLFSEVGKLEATSRIRKGSHLDVARLLAPAGKTGLSFVELSNQLDQTSGRLEVLATGKAGTVCLSHPFQVYAAQPFLGEKPRFLAQPPLYLGNECKLHRKHGSYSPVETAIRLGIGMDTLSE